MIIKAKHKISNKEYTVTNFQNYKDLLQTNYIYIEQSENKIHYVTKDNFKRIKLPNFFTKQTIDCNIDNFRIALDNDRIDIFYNHEGNEQQILSIVKPLGCYESLLSADVGEITGINNLMQVLEQSIREEYFDKDTRFENFPYKELFARIIKKIILETFDYYEFKMISTNISDNFRYESLKKKIGLDVFQILDELSLFSNLVRINPNSARTIKIWIFKNQYAFK